MAVSGSVDFGLNTNEIVEKAFGILGKNSEGVSLSAKMYEDGRSSLNLLLKTLGTNERLFLKTERSVTLIASTASYALTPRPNQVLSVRRRDSDDYDVALEQMSRQEYFDTPNKTVSPSTPISWYYDPQQATGTLYVWPAPDTTAASEFALQLTYTRRISDMDATGDDLDMPQEWLQAIVWNLANDLETEYPVNDPRIAQKIERKAAMLMLQLESWDTEMTSIFMQPADEY